MTCRDDNYTDSGYVSTELAGIRRTGSFNLAKQRSKVMFR